MELLFPGATPPRTRGAPRPLGARTVLELTGSDFGRPDPVPMPRRHAMALLAACLGGCGHAIRATSCKAQLKLLCAASQGDPVKCGECAGAHAGPLKAAHCTDAEISQWCTRQPTPPPTPKPPRGRCMAAVPSPGSWCHDGRGSCNSTACASGLFGCIQCFVGAGDCCCWVSPRCSAYKTKASREKNRLLLKRGVKTQGRTQNTIMRQPNFVGDRWICLLPIAKGQHRQLQ